LSCHDFIVARTLILDILKSSHCILDRKAGQDNISLEIDPDGLMYINLSDGSMFIQTQVEITITTYSQSINNVFSLSVNLLYDLLRRLDSKNIQMIVEDKNVILKYDDGDFTLAKFNANLYPVSIDGDSVVFKLHTGQLSDTLRVLKSTMSNEDIREQFRGISAILKEKKLVLWSTDGTKMSLSELAVDCPQEIEGIWPRKFIEILLSINTDKTAKFLMYKKHIKCEIDGITITSPLINAKLLDYHAILGNNLEPTISILIDAQYLTKKLDRMMILIESDEGVLFEINENPIITCSNKQRSDKGVERLENLSYTGVETKFYANCSIILSFIRNLKGNIRLNYYVASKNIVIHKENDEFPFFLTKAMTPRSI